MSESIQPAPLAFQDQELVLLYHDQPGKARFWYGGEESFYRAHLLGETVEFMKIDPVTNVEVYERDDVEETIQTEGMRLLPDHSGTYKVRLKGEERERFAGFLIPRAETLNQLGKTTLQALGAHTTPIKLFDGSGEDGIFTALEMAEIIESNEAFPASTAAHLHLHDMRNHGFGIVSLEDAESRTFRKLCGAILGMSAEDFDIANELAVFALHALDVATFSGSDDDCRQITIKRRDPLFELIIRYITDRQSYDLVTNVLTSQGFYLIDGIRVKRPPASMPYYLALNELLQDDDDVAT